MKRIRNRHLIPYPPQQVWAVLTDFKAHANWNPLNVWADGEALPGARVGMRFVDAGGGKGKIIAQTVTVTACDPGRRLEWLGISRFCSPAAISSSWRKAMTAPSWLAARHWQEGS